MKRGRKEITRISRISKYVIEFWKSRMGERENEEREWQFRLGKCGCRGAVEARNIQFTRYAFFALFGIIVANRMVRHGSPLAAVHVAQITGVITVEERGGRRNRGAIRVFLSTPSCLPVFVSLVIDRSTRFEFT